MSHGMVFRSRKWTTMPRKSTKVLATKTTRPKLKDNEGVYIEWLHSPAGQKAETEARRRREKRPVIAVETPVTPSEMRELIRKTGANLRLVKGLTHKPNDPSVIQEIIDRAGQKRTRSISIRLSVEDLEAAKRLGEKTGLGYQTVLKDLIHEGLRRV